MSRGRLAVMGWIGLFALFVVLVPVTLRLNRPNVKRLEQARHELAEAGYPGARVSASQRVGHMARCSVGQVWKKGRAYGWETSSHRGVFCLPEDGRPSRILVDPKPGK